MPASLELSVQNFGNGPAFGVSVGLRASEDWITPEGDTQYEIAALPADASRTGIRFRRRGSEHATAFILHIQFWDIYDRSFTIEQSVMPGVPSELRAVGRPITSVDGGGRSDPA